MLSFFLLLGSCSEAPGISEQSGQLNYTKVDYFVTKADTLEEIITVPGKTTPFEMVNLYSEINGRIKSIQFEEGVHVKKGELLMVVDTDILQAEKDKLEVDLQLAEKEKKRKKNLLDSEAGTQQAYDQAESDVNSLTAQIKSLEVQIGKGRIKAPFEGTIGLREVSPGAYITTSDLITTIAQLSALKVNFSVAQRYAHRVKKGQKIALVPPSDSIDISSVEATVYAMSPTINQNTQMLDVRAKLTQTNNIIAGGYVNVQYNLGKMANSIKVPSTAIVPVIDGQIVWVMKDGKSTERRVNIGSRTNTHVQIYGDIKSNDTVIVTGLLGMREGKAVKAKKEIK